MFVVQRLLSYNLLQKIWGNCLPLLCVTSVFHSTCLCTHSIYLRLLWMTLKPVPRSWASNLQPQKAIWSVPYWSLSPSGSSFRGDCFFFNFWIMIIHGLPYFLILCRNHQLYETMLKETRIPITKIRYTVHVSTYLIIVMWVGSAGGKDAFNSRLATAAYCAISDCRMQILSSRLNLPEWTLVYFASSVFIGNPSHVYFMFLSDPSSKVSCSVT